VICPLCCRRFGSETERTGHLEWEHGGLAEVVRFLDETVADRDRWREHAQLDHDTARRVWGLAGRWRLSATVVRSYQYSNLPDLENSVRTATVLDGFADALERAITGETRAT
jgi:hypothetical protein